MEFSKGYIIFDYSNVNRSWTYYFYELINIFNVFISNMGTF